MGGGAIAATDEDVSMARCAVQPSQTYDDHILLRD